MTRYVVHHTFERMPADQAARAAAIEKVTLLLRATADRAGFRVPDDSVVEVSFTPSNFPGDESVLARGEAWVVPAHSAGDDAAVDLTDPNSGHGHLRPRPDGVKARCGGPALCKECQREAAAMEKVPGGCGSTGPGPAAYFRPHVYARDVRSGAGNCVCGGALGDRVHTEAAPGVPIPKALRRG